MRPLPLLAVVLLTSACATPGDEPYASWQTAAIVEGGFSIRYLAPPWELDLGVLPPELGLEVPFQHETPAGLPSPPPAYVFRVTGASGGTTDLLAVAMEASLGARGDVIRVGTRPFETRGGLAGHETISEDDIARFHRETFVAMPSGAVLHMSLECNDDADDRDVDDLFTSLAALP